jgi:putative tricarboxylic transport membrane protein
MSQDVNASHQGTPAHHESHFLGGVLIAVLALGLLGWTFFISSPTVPRVLSIAIGLIGVGTAAGFIPVRGAQDYYGGLALALVGTLALVASADLPGQRGFAFGPGTAPRLFAGLLAALGFAVAAVGAFSDGPKITVYKIRGPAFVIVSILLFAMLIRPFGLVISTFLAFMVSISGSTEMRWIESLIAAAFMTAMCVGLFVYLLNLPFQLWPPENALQLLTREWTDLLRPVLPFLFTK